jgi:hypothetical protein
MSKPLLPLGSTLDSTPLPDTASTSDLEPFIEDFEQESQYLILLKEGLARAVWMVTVGFLTPKDFVVLMTYIQFADWRTGRCRCSIEKLEEILERKRVTLYPSIKRLKQQKLIVPFRDQRTGEKLHLISPELLKAGSGARRGYLLKTYYEAIKSNEPGDDTEDAEL